MGPALRTHLLAHPEAAFLVTCRRRVSGGHFAGTPKQEMDILLEAARAGCSFVDLSLESAEALPESTVPQLRAAGAAVLLSWHDFERTGDLHAVLERMRPFAPDVYKIVPTAQHLADTLPLLELLRTEAARSSPAVVGISMGECGLVSRILGVRAGSAFTFAAPEAGQATAPGQIDARTLRERYRVEQLTPQTRMYGVAGSPVSSSVSPAMLNAAFTHAGMDAVYLPLLTEDPAELFHLAAKLPLAGFSVTMPLKQAVLP